MTFDGSSFFELSTFFGLGLLVGIVIVVLIGSDGFSFDAIETVGDDVADEIVIDAFAMVVTVELVDVLIRVDSMVFFCASSAFCALLSSFAMLAVLFVIVPDGTALYDSDVMAANGFGGG